MRNKEIESWIGCIKATLPTVVDTITVFYGLPIYSINGTDRNSIDLE
jgi:hypothetical protein